jgi:heme exporter protein B
LIKETLEHWRGRDALAGTLTVALLVALAGYVAFIARVPPAAAVPGVLWIGIVFAAQVGLARSFITERDRGTLDSLLTSPADPLHLFLAKLLLNTASSLLVALVLFGGLWLFFAPTTGFHLLHLLVLLLGVFGTALVTTMTAAIAMHGRNWVLLVPLLSLPALYPVLATATPATTILIEGGTLASVLPGLRVLLAYDVILLVIAWLLVPYLMEP